MLIECVEVELKFYTMILIRARRIYWQVLTLSLWFNFLIAAVDWNPRVRRIAIKIDFFFFKFNTNTLYAMFNCNVINISIILIRLFLRCYTPFLLLPYSSRIDGYNNAKFIRQRAANNVHFCHLIQLSEIKILPIL